jgi:tetratricopeptide (TPR) repeat protein
MLLAGARGLAWTTDSAAAVAALDGLEQQLLVYGLEAAVGFEAAAADPGFAAGHAVAAALHLFTLSPAGHAAAAPHVAAARAAAPGASPRERLFVDAIRAWHEADPVRALACHEAIADRWPRDLISARIAMLHQLNRGDFAAMRRLTTRLMAANPDVPQVKGAHAFALEQTGESDAAERLGREAADAAFDPWAEHAVAHALERQERAAEALAWLGPRADGWARCSSFLYTHNWWHVALFHLALGERAAALALYDRRVWGVRKAYCQDQANAVSLLARLDLLGVDVGDRWQELAAWLKPRTAEQVNGLLDLHYAYGLAMAGADAHVARLTDSLRDRARRDSDPLWHHIVPTAAAGLVAHAAGRMAEAARLLGSVLPHLHLAGGSSTQRQLFHLVHRDATRLAGC